MTTTHKLILFDIDGTLLTPGPIPRTALAEALSGFLGEPVKLDFHDVAGFTDPTIIRNALQRNGYRRLIDAQVIETILADYLDLVTKRLPASDGVRVFPGAKELVIACRNEGWATALLTGNVRPGADLKLANTGLRDLFAFGVFGADGNSREDLPWVARERAWEVLSIAFQPADIILVGDTPNDARIAKLNDIHSLIVCRRGEPEWREGIEAESPTWMVDDFENVQMIIELFKDHS